MKLILFRGRPGTGKTLLSGLLSAKINVAVIRKDDIYDMVSVLHTSHQLRNQATYNTLYAILKSNLSNNATIILDFPFQFDDDIRHLTNWCKINSAELKSILVTCSDEDLWAARFNERAKNPQPNQLIVDFEELKKRYPAMQLVAGPEELTVDTVIEPEINLLRIIDFIG